MIYMLPNDAIIGCTPGCYTSRNYQSAEWLMFYQWLFEQFQRWNKRGAGCEIFNMTSSINNSSLQALKNNPGDQVMKALANLFCQSGRKNLAGKFLASQRIRTWRDLDKHIGIPGWRPKNFPNQTWFSLFGRWFKKPGPNKCHPEARWHDRASLRLRNDGRWVMSFYLDYYRDGGSSWSVDVIQEYRESLDKFAARVNARIEEIFEPTVTTPLDRACYERDWNRTFDALQDLFCEANRAPPYKWEYCKEMVKLADELRGVEGPVRLAGHITLTPARTAALRRWMMVNK